MGRLGTVALAQQRSDTGDWAQASVLWQQVVDANPVNGSYWDYLAEARDKLGEHQAAIAAYDKVLELGAWGKRLADTVYPGEVAYRIACCHLRLGHREDAVAALSRALRLAFRDLERPRADPLWEPLRPRGDVRDMLGIIDADTMSRDEGWRADLAFFAREVRRRTPSRDLDEAEFGGELNVLAVLAALIAGSDISLAAGLSVVGAGILACEVMGVFFGATITTTLERPVILAIAWMVGYNLRARQVQAEQSAALLAKADQLREEQAKVATLDERARDDHLG